MRDLTMRCGWCGSTDVEAEYAHNGVGYQQCGPHICATCGAVEISPYNEDPVTNEEKLRGYHMGDESEELRVAWPPYWDVPERAVIKAWSTPEKGFFRVWLHGVTHVASRNKGLIHTLCDLRRTDAYVPDHDVTTCVVCAQFNVTIATRHQEGL